MKTHDVAKALSALAQLLRKGPNVTLDELARQLSQSPKPDSLSIPVALSALVALSQIDKTQWRNLIHEYDLPIEVRSTESSRDVVGKILRHLEQDAESRRKIKNAASKSRSDVSPELMNALNFLLR